VLAEDAHLSAGGREQTGEHLDGGGFAGAVRSEKTVKRSAPDLQVETVHSADRAELPRESPSFNREVHHLGWRVAFSDAGSEWIMDGKCKLARTSLPSFWSLPSIWSFWSFLAT